jgi:hypothetical protein
LEKTNKIKVESLLWDFTSLTPPAVASPDGTLETASMGIMMCPDEMCGRTGDAVQNARSQLTLCIVANVVVDASASNALTEAALVRVRDAMCRRYEVLQRCGQVLKASSGTPVAYRSADGFSVRWSKPDASIALHDVLLVNAADATAPSWHETFQHALDAGFPLFAETTSAGDVVHRHAHPPWRIIASVRGAEVTIGMVFNHVVADGTSALRLIRDVCTALNGALSGSGDVDLGPPLRVPPSADVVLFGGQAASDIAWWEHLLLMLISLLLALFPKAILKPEVPNIAAKTPFRSAMAWGDTCSKAEWQSLLAACKAHGVKPQAAMDAVSLFLTASVIAHRNGGVGTSKPIGTEIVMPVTMRSAERVLPGRQHYSDDDVGFTIAFAKVAAHVAASDTFWAVAKRIQASIDKELSAKSLRFTTLVFGFMMGWLISHKEHASVLATYDPINLGRNVSDLQFDKCRAVGAAIGQKSIPMIAPAFGYLWPVECNGRCTFSLEYESQLWTKEQGQALLSLFTSVLFNPPPESETFAQFASRLREPLNQLK